MEHLRCGIIVVDNGSSDRTAELVDLFADHPVAVTVIGCSTGGKGAAIRRGIQVSTARFVGFCDADLATPEPGGRSRPVPNDDADLSLILTVLRAFKAHETATGVSSGVKVLREALFFHWESPRLPAGGKYSPALLHSPAARERREQGHRGGLVHEHVLPVSILIRQLLADVPADEEALRLAIEAWPERVIITKTEDDALNAAGMRNTTPAPDDRWSRYRAAGLDPSGFAPL